MICSGKSTLANSIKGERDAVILSPDEWVLKLHGADFPVERFQEVGDRIKAVIWDVARPLLDRGTDVILDFSFWGREDRTNWRAIFAKGGYEAHLYYTHCSDRDELFRRLEHRNAEVVKGELQHFNIAPETLATWLQFLEPPMPEEAAIVTDTCT
jgi:hypothetical protein